jgi:hypothetical protein
MHLATLDQLESLSLEGNPIYEDEKAIRKFISSNLKQITVLNGQPLTTAKPTEYNVVSSPSQATTGGCGGYSQSLPNIPDILRELSTFSNTKPVGLFNNNNSGDS